MKNLILGILVLSSFSALANPVAKSFNGKYQLKSGDPDNCQEKVLDISFRQDGVASNCLFGGGPSLALTQNESLVIKCLDQEQKGWMDNYRCNFVSDALTSTRGGDKVITQRFGRKCILSSTKWSSIET